MFVTSYSATFCIYISGKLGFLFSLLLGSLWWVCANGRICLGLQIVCLYITPSHYHHCASLSEDIELSDACQIYFCECVNKIKHTLSVIHHTICGAVCFQFNHSLVMSERMYILCLIVNMKSEVWTIIHYLGLGHETMVYAVCLYILILLWGYESDTSNCRGISAYLSKVNVFSIT